MSFASPSDYAVSAVYYSCIYITLVLTDQSKLLGKMINDTVNQENIAFLQYYVFSTMIRVGTGYDSCKNRCLR